MDVLFAFWQVYNMFQHQSLGIKVNIRVTKLVLLRSRPVSSDLFWPCCHNCTVVVSHAEQHPCARGRCGACQATQSQIVNNTCHASPGSMRGGKYRELWEWKELPSFFSSSLVNLCLLIVANQFQELIVTKTKIIWLWYQINNFQTYKIFKYCDILAYECCQLMEFVL